MLMCLGQYWRRAHILAPPASKWETRMAFRAPKMGMVQSRLLWSFEGVNHWMQLATFPRTTLGTSKEEKPPEHPVWLSRGDRAPVKWGQLVTCHPERVVLIAGWSCPVTRSMLT